MLPRPQLLPGQALVLVPELAVGQRSHRLVAPLLVLQTLQ